MSKRARPARRTFRLESLETRTLLAADLASMHNSTDGADVNADGAVTMTDALLTVQELRRMRSGGGGERGPGQFPDVDGNGQVTINDALHIVNRLRRSRHGGDRPDGNPEPDQQPPRPPETASIDGTGNNLANPDWGSTEEAFLRITTPEYGDGISTPAGEDRTSAREISNLVFDQEQAHVNDRGLTALVWQWGQFIDHDITLTQAADPTEAFAIEVPTGDIYFDPTGVGDQAIGLTRSAYEATTGDSLESPRQQVNSITAFLDGSVIYGSDAQTAATLREGVGGRMLVSEGDLLPIDPLSGMFQAGDIRANEQPGLTAMQTLFVREHNQQAARIAEQHPDWPDEQIFQAARRIVVGELQAITYNEFLPSLLGRELPEYRGYDPEVNPGISNLFATAAYRFGHSMVSSSYDLVDNAGELIESLSLAGAFFNPSIIQTHGIDPTIKGLTEQLSQEIDTQVVDELRSFLFGPPGAGGLDLVALNIQRGRDHGLADYNQTRIDLGLPPVESFAEITSDTQSQARLEAAYESVDEIDVWVGILAEDHLRGSSVGELGTRVMVDQFLRLRDGDRFYYENLFSGNQLDRLEQTRLSEIIERNTELTNLDRNVFVQREAIVDGGDPADRTGRERDRRERDRDNRPREREADRLDSPVEEDLTGQLAGGEQERPGDRRGAAGHRRENADDEATLPLESLDPEVTDQIFADLG